MPLLQQKNSVALETVLLSREGERHRLLYFLFSFAKTSIPWHLQRLHCFNDLQHGPAFGCIRDKRGGTDEDSTWFAHHEGERTQLQQTGEATPRRPTEGTVHAKAESRVAEANNRVYAESTTVDEESRREM